MIGELQSGQCFFGKGVIDHVTDEDRSRVAVVFPERYGPDPIDDVPPLPMPYLEPIPVAGDPVWIIEFPGGNMYWLAIAPDQATTADRAVLYAPLKAILLAILGDLDKIHDHQHTFAIGGIAVDTSTGLNTAPISTPKATGLGYGDARKDTEDDKAKSLRVRIVTAVPRGEA